MSTSCPFWTSSRAPAGVNATRYSSVLISLATPMRKTRGTLAATAVPQVHQQARERLCVVQLRQPRLQLVDRPAEELQHLVVVRLGLTLLDAFGEVDVHPFPAEAGRRPERREERPFPAGEAALLSQLALRGCERLLPGLALARGDLDEPCARRFTELPHERDGTVAVDRDDRHRVGMLDDLSFAAVPPLESDVDQLPFVDGP